MAKVDIAETVRKYDTFINDVLREDLKRLQFRLQKIDAEMADLIQQRHTLKTVTNKKIHPAGFKTQINLGCNFFMEASVKDTSKVLVNIGLCHYLECTIAEANKYLNVKIKALERTSEELNKKVAEVSAHIKLMLFGLGQLQDEQKNENIKKN